MWEASDNSPPKSITLGDLKLQSWKANVASALRRTHPLLSENAPHICLLTTGSSLNDFGDREAILTLIGTVINNNVFSVRKPTISNEDYNRVAKKSI